MIVYTHEQAARGDIGPCMMHACTARADLTVTLAVDGAECITWLCKAHTAPYRSQYAAAS